MCDDAKEAGHGGVGSTIERITRYFHWPQMYKHVKDHVTSCTQCQTAKVSRKKPYGLLQPLKPPERPWNAITMDFISQLPEATHPISKTKHDSICVVVCRLTKMAHFIPCSATTDAPQLAQIMFEHVFRIHGVPVSYTHLTLPTNREV